MQPCILLLFIALAKRLYALRPPHAARALPLRLNPGARSRALRLWAPSWRCQPRWALTHEPGLPSSWAGRVLCRASARPPNRK